MKGMWVVVLLVGVVGAQTEGPDAVLGVYENYGWVPESRVGADGDPTPDDYVLVRLADGGTFTDNLDLFAISEGNGVAAGGLGFKRYGFRTHGDFMFTAQVINNGRCPVWMSLIGFSEEGHRDITGGSNDIWNGNLPTDNELLQPYYQMHLGTADPGGIGQTLNTAPVNWFTNDGPTDESLYTIYEGKYVDGQPAIPTTNDHIQTTRLPVFLSGDTCSEAPVSNRQYLAFDVAHIDLTASTTLSSTFFPGAYDDATYMGCVAGESTNVDIVIRFVDMRLLTDLTFPNAEPPRSLAQKLAVSADQNSDPWKYAGNITVTRAASEVYITEYRVYSYYDDAVEGMVLCQPGDPFMVLTVPDDCETGLICRKGVAASSPNTVFQDQLELPNKACNNFVVFSANEAGEDSLNFIRYAQQPPVVENFIDAGSTKKQDMIDKKQDMTNKKQGMTDEVLSSSTLSDPTAVPATDSIHAAEPPAHTTPRAKSAHVKFVPATSDSVSTSVVDGRSVYTRSISASLSDTYLTDKADETDIYESDGAIKAGGFNMPYHRWIFTPSSMSAWDVNVVNLNPYDATTNVGLKGFAVMPSEYCVGRNSTGEGYLTPDEIQSQCEEQDDDHFWWFDLTSDSTTVWSESCWSEEATSFQVLLVVESGFTAEYSLGISYIDYLNEATVASNERSGTYLGCIKKGQTRDFSLPYSFPYSSLNARVTGSATVQGMYVATGSDLASQDNFVASDIYTTGWSRRVSTSAECVDVTTTVGNNIFLSHELPDDAGSWHVRLYKEAASTLSDDDVEFTLSLTVASSTISVRTSSNPNYNYEASSNVGFVSNGAFQIYKVVVPALQQLIVSVTENNNFIDSVFLKQSNCPSLVFAECVDDDPDSPCYVDFSPTSLGVFEVTQGAEFVSESDTTWYIMVVGRTQVGDTLTDEATFTVSYEFIPELPPSPSNLPSIESCSRFSPYCGQSWISTSPSSRSSMSLVALALSLVFALLH